VLEARVAGPDSSDVGDAEVPCEAVDELMGEVVEMGSVMLAGSCGEGGNVLGGPDDAVERVQLRSAVPDSRDEIPPARVWPSISAVDAATVVLLEPPFPNEKADHHRRDPMAFRVFGHREAAGGSWWLARRATASSLCRWRRRALSAETSTSVGRSMSACVRRATSSSMWFAWA
jgi:hypothetical protein